MTKHNKRAHALLSASGAARWLNCTPSARLEDKIADKESPYAREGTLAHEFADIELQFRDKQITKAKYTAARKKLEKEEFYNPEMDEEVEKYVDYVWSQYQEARRKNGSAVLLVEDKIDLTEFIEEGFGSNDAAIISDNTMEIVDLKYGKGIKVNAKDNPQLKLYGLGALRAHELMYDIHEVRMTVVQPRLDHIPSAVLPADELRAWGYNEVVPKARLAYAGKGDLVPGDHCRWCKIKARCPALAEENLKLAKHEFASPELLSDDELLDIYGKIAMLEDWAKGVANHILDEALNGKKWPGYKLVEGRANRKWANEDEAISTLEKEGYEKDKITKTKIRGIGEIEKLVGKKKFPKLLNGMVIKPQGKPALVDESDKRPELNTEECAKQDFT